MRKHIHLWPCLLLALLILIPSAFSAMDRDPSARFEIAPSDGQLRQEVFRKITSIAHEPEEYGIKNFQFSCLYLSPQIPCFEFVDGELVRKDFAYYDIETEQHEMIGIMSLMRTDEGYGSSFSSGVYTEERSSLHQSRKAYSILYARNAAYAYCDGSFYKLHDILSDYVSYRDPVSFEELSQWEDDLLQLYQPPVWEDSDWLKIDLSSEEAISINSTQSYASVNVANPSVPE